MNTLAFNENIKNLTVSGIYILLLALAQDIQGITLDTTNTMQVDNK